MSESGYDPDRVDPSNFEPLGTSSWGSLTGLRKRALGPRTGIDPSQQSAHAKTVQTLSVWVSQHPAPDQPAISIASLGEYSPQALLDAVEQRTEAGKFFETMIHFGAKRMDGNLDAVLASFLEEKAAEDEPSVVENETESTVLKPQEQAMMMLLAKGHSSFNIARILGIAEVTVRSYAARIFPKART